MIKHGYAKRDTLNIPEYTIWAAMRGRCNNPNNPVYKYYGGRGISICSRWDNFANFIADMGRRPNKLTLDRIDNDGNYEPDNCRWATMLEQVKNKRHQPNQLGRVGLRKKGNVWQARITNNYKEIYLGTFKTRAEAVSAREKAERMYA